MLQERENLLKQKARLEARIYMAEKKEQEKSILAEKKFQEEHAVLQRHNDQLSAQVRAAMDPQKKDK